MKNYNMISLEVLKSMRGNASDPNISCDRCPSACCRTGVALELSNNEAAHLREGGTKLEKLEKNVVARVLRLKPELDYYEMKSDCSNLSVDEQTGETSCGAYGEPERPKICVEYRTGTIQCGDMQLARVKRLEDEFADKSE